MSALRTLCCNTTRRLHFLRSNFIPLHLTWTAIWPCLQYFQIAALSVVRLLGCMSPHIRIHFLNSTNCEMRNVVKEVYFLFLWYQIKSTPTTLHMHHDASLNFVWDRYFKSKTIHNFELSALSTFEIICFWIRSVFLFQKILHRSYPSNKDKESFTKILTKFLLSQWTSINMHLSSDFGCISTDREKERSWW
jgi:hypothetical protein